MLSSLDSFNSTPPNRVLNFPSLIPRSAPTCLEQQRQRQQEQSSAFSSSATSPRNVGWASLYRSFQNRIRNQQQQHTNNTATAFSSSSSTTSTAPNQLSRIHRDYMQLWDDQQARQEIERRRMYIRR